MVNELVTEAERAYVRGVEDALSDRERKNGSDFYGPYGHDYDMGYESGLVKRRKASYKVRL